MFMIRGHMRKEQFVLMADGTEKEAKDIRVGDAVMGDDRKPRTVVSLVRGSEGYAMITPEFGDCLSLSESMILPVLRNDGRVIELSVGELLRMGKDKVSGYRLIRTESVKGRAAIAHLPFTVKKIAPGWCTAFKVDGNGRFLLSGGMVIKR